MDDNLNLNAICKKTKALGPGNRFVIWTQGCGKRCKGCETPESQPFIDNILINFNALADIILETKDIEGITISGGEPFLQAKNLYHLSVIVKKHDLGIIVYSGFTLKEINLLKDKYAQKLVSMVDVIIDGEYLEELNDDIGLRGSGNQKVNFITNRYKNYENDFCNNIREIDIRRDKIIGIRPKGLDAFLSDYLNKRKTIN